jgi:hypothetical protein
MFEYNFGQFESYNSCLTSIMCCAHVNIVHYACQIKFTNTLTFGAQLMTWWFNVLSLIKHYSLYLLEIQAGTCHGNSIIQV